MMPRVPPETTSDGCLKVTPLDIEHWVKPGFTAGGSRWSGPGILGTRTRYPLSPARPSAQTARPTGAGAAEGEGMTTVARPAFYLALLGAATGSRPESHARQRCQPLLGSATLPMAARLGSSSPHLPSCRDPRPALMRIGTNMVLNSQCWTWQWSRNGRGTVRDVGTGTE